MSIWIFLMAWFWWALYLLLTPVCELLPTPGCLNLLNMLFWLWVEVSPAEDFLWTFWAFFWRYPPDLDPFPAPLMVSFVIYLWEVWFEFLLVEIVFWTWLLNFLSIIIGLWRLISTPWCIFLSFFDPCIMVWAVWDWYPIFSWSLLEHPLVLLILPIPVALLIILGYGILLLYPFIKICPFFIFCGFWSFGNC